MSDPISHLPPASAFGSSRLTSVHSPVVDLLDSPSDLATPAGPTAAECHADMLDLTGQGNCTMAASPGRRPPTLLMRKDDPRLGEIPEFDGDFLDLLGLGSTSDSLDFAQLMQWNA